MHNLTIGHVNNQSIWRAGIVAVWEEDSEGEPDTALVEYVAIFYQQGKSKLGLCVEQEI